MTVQPCISLEAPMVVVWKYLAYQVPGKQWLQFSADTLQGAKDTARRYSDHYAFPIFMNPNERELNNEVNSDVKVAAC